MVNLIKVGPREDASAVLEEIRRWWPGNCHDFLVGAVSAAVGKDGRDRTRVKSDEEQGLPRTEARGVTARTFIP